MDSYAYIFIYKRFLRKTQFFSKKYQSLEGAAPVSGLKFNVFIGLFTAIIFFIIIAVVIVANVLSYRKARSKKK